MSLSLMGWGSGSFLRTSEEVFLGGGGAYRCCLLDFEGKLQ